MKTILRLHQWLSAVFRSNGLALLAILGVMAGIATSLVIAGFLGAISWVLGAFHGAESDSFSALPPYLRFLLPLMGSVILIVLFKYTPNRYHDVGIAHVIDRLQRGRGKLPIGNTAFQFTAALTVLASGFSLGKEGPAVHVGSGIASKLGRFFHRTPSQLRILTGCGTAAAVSSAFGTPLAGVMFAMEVVLMEYSLLGFIPILAASVSAALTADLVFGGHLDVLPFIDITAIDYSAHWIVITGAVTGLVAALMHRLIKLFLTLHTHSKARRFLLAGLITGALGFAIPQVLGLGYDVMREVLVGHFAWWLLIIILIGKVIATSAAVGLGIPAGIVGPSLFIGIVTGGLIGFVVPGSENDAFYTLIGMAGVMSALLHAPLAALTAVLELSGSANVMLPAMIVVVLANLICQVLFQQPSIFQTLLSNRGLSVSTHPLRHALESRFLTEIATENFSVIAHSMDALEIETLLKNRKKLAIFRSHKHSHLMPSQLLAQRYEAWQLLENKDKIDVSSYLMQIIPQRSRLAILDNDLSLLEAIQLLNNQDVVGIQVPLDEFRVGLVTRTQLTTVLTAEGDMH